MRIATARCNARNLLTSLKCAARKLRGRSAATTAVYAPNSMKYARGATINQSAISFPREKEKKREVIPPRQLLVSSSLFSTSRALVNKTRSLYPPSWRRARDGSVSRICPVILIRERYCSSMLHVQRFCAPFLLLLFPNEANDARKAISQPAIDSSRS